MYKQVCEIMSRLSACCKGILSFSGRESKNNRINYFKILTGLQVEPKDRRSCMMAGGGGGGGGTLMYKLYGYVPLLRVWFSSSLVWDRV